MDTEEIIVSLILVSFAAALWCLMLFFEVYHGLS